MATTFQFKRGAPIAFARRVLAGDPEGYELRAVLKPTTSAIVPDEDVAEVAEFAIEFQPAEGDQPARWLLTINADAADALERGRYVTDVQFAIDGEPVQMSDPAFIVLVGSVSG